MISITALNLSCSVDKDAITVLRVEDEYMYLYVM